MRFRERSSLCALPRELARDRHGAARAANPHVGARRLKALAVTTRSRAKAQPELPTTIEAGIRDFGVEQWQGVFPPAAVPADVVARLHAAFAYALRQPT